MSNPIVRSQEPEARSRKQARRLAVTRGSLWRSSCLVASGFWLLASSPLPAQPTQEQVLQSISDTVGEPIDSRRMVAVVAGAGGVVLLLVVAGQRRRDVRAKTLNHTGKLMHEVLKTLPLKRAEIKQLEILAQDARPGGARVQSPLTLLLCPSLLGAAAKESRGKADLPVVAGLMKKLLAEK